MIFGSTGGIGSALVAALNEDSRCAEIFAAARNPAAGTPRVTALRFSLEEEESIAEAIACASADAPLDLVVVATGVLHNGGMQPEKSWRAIEADALERAFRINATGPALIAKHALPRLPKDRKAVFTAISARVGSISDNRLGGWHAYRASKAALNMLVRTWSMELARSHPLAACVALHPGTVDTKLSRPFQMNLRPGQLLSPQQSVAAILRVIDRSDHANSGQLLSWDGSVIPY
jgi:NAD(P)-dependent dehydrogenase (short-subunit alcohol dehydrogenase family)